MIRDQVLRALDQDLNELPAWDGQVSQSDQWWVTLVPPDGQELADVEAPALRCDGFEDAVAEAARLLVTRPDYAALAVAVVPGMARVIVQSLVIRPADLGEVRYTIDGMRDAARRVTTAHEQAVRSDDARRALLIAAEQASPPPPLPSGPDLNDHLYQNKVAFRPRMKCPRCETTMEGVQRGAAVEWRCPSCFAGPDTAAEGKGGDQ